ncbi:bleomycin resistance protein [Calothrix sp. HK-06]|nr:bleomycin resistance protein [Calothrix sp. HK-06]
MKLGTFNHIALTVTNLARSEAFYDKLLGFMGYKQAEKNENFILWANSHNGAVITISPSNPQSSNKFHDRYSPGLHHLAFGADSRDDVNKLYKFLVEQGTEILDPPSEYDYMPGYYAVFFLDPDGIKLELTYIPNW